METKITKYSQSRAVTSWEVNNIDKPLASLTKRERRAKLTNLEMKGGDVIRDSNEIQRTNGEYFETFIINLKKN